MGLFFIGVASLEGGPKFKFSKTRAKGSGMRFRDMGFECKDLGFALGIQVQGSRAL